jgi:hypothetical protein
MQPHSVKDLYYWAMRPEQPYNTVVDISDYLDKKVASMSANKAQGPAGAAGRRLKARLAAEGKRLPALDGEEEEADRQYIRLFGLQEYQRIGAPHGLQHAEPFYYIPPGGTFTGSMSGADIESYITEHAEQLP